MLRWSVLTTLAACGSQVESRMDQRIDAMHRHVEHGTDAVAALEDGDLDRLREAGKALSRGLDVPGLAPESEALLQATRDVAATLSSSHDLASGALHLAELADLCGRCHDGLEVPVEADPQPSPPRQAWLALATRDEATWTAVVPDGPSGWPARRDALSGLLTAVVSPRPVSAAMKSHMDHHFAEATDAVWGIAMGDLEGAREAALRLDHPADPGFGSKRDGEVDRMRRAARALGTASDAAEAAELSVELANSCAACHQAMGHPLLRDSDVLMPTTTDVGRHGMASYALWVGLVVPSDRAYLEGAAALLPAPAAPTEAPEATRAFAAIGARAPLASGGERGAVWVSVITSCRTCHGVGDLPVF